MTKEQDYKHVVLAMDTLIGDPSIINPEPDDPKIADTMIIPDQYVDRFYSNFNEQTVAGDSIRECMEIFKQHMKKSKDRRRFKLENGSVLEIRDLKREDFNGLNPESSGHQAIAMAKTSKTPYPIYTGSSRLIPVVYLHDLDVVEVVQEPYIGRRKLKLPFQFSNEWFSNHKISAETFAQMFPDEKPLRANEFVEFDFGNGPDRGHNFEHIGRWDQCEEQLVPLKYIRNLPYKIRPLNSGQAMLAEALMAPSSEIPIVIVPASFGTGKTFLATAAGLAQTEGNGHEPSYEKIFVCPRDGHLGREQGYLPGEMTNKLDPLMDPIKDQLRKIIKLRGPKKSKYREKRANQEELSPNQAIAEEIDWYLYESKLFEIKPIIVMGGRSIDDAFIIYDEFQDMERGQAKALLTRIGNGSKIVAMGDPTQFTNPHLSKTSNGLVFAANTFSRRKYKGAAIITLFPKENVRSEPARAISEIFEKH